MYNTITPITTPYGDNMGGVCSFQFVPKEWLVDEVSIDYSTGVVTVTPVLIAGKSWLNASCVERTMEYAEKDKSDKGGNYVEATLGGQLLRDDAAMHANIDTLRYHELVVIYTDANGQRRIIGNKAKGMSFAADYTTGKAPADASSWTISLVHQMPESAPVFTGN